MYYEPSSIAYHERSAGEGASTNPLEIISARRGISEFSKYHSFANQRLMQIKNETLSLFLRHAPIILAKEFVAWPYVLLCEKHGIRSAFKFFKLLPKTLSKRKDIMRTRIVSEDSMRSWFL